MKLVVPQAMDAEDERQLAVLKNQSLVLLHQLRLGQTDLEHSYLDNSLNLSHLTVATDRMSDSYIAQQRLGRGSQREDAAARTAKKLPECDLYTQRKMYERGIQSEKQSAHQSAEARQKLLSSSTRKGGGERPVQKVTQSATGSNSVRHGSANIKSLANVQNRPQSNAPRSGLEMCSFDNREKANTSVTFQEVDSSDSDSKALTSTPVKSPKNGSSGLLNDDGTPKSILKRRKIIDDNVKVDSKYPHTPTTARTPRRKSGLNYSYRDESFDAEAHLDNVLNRSKGPRYSNATDGSYIEEFLEDENNVQKVASPKSGSTVGHPAGAIAESGGVKPSEVQALLEENRLRAAGNDRKNAKTVMDLSQRPKSVVFDSEAVQPPAITDKVAARQTRSTRPVGAGGKEWGSHGGNPLLGYDWIAGTLENQSALLSQPEAYFEEIHDFRRVNRSECNATSLVNGYSADLDLTRPISPEVKDPGHTCIHGYTVNDRLFTEPVTYDEQGKPVCPVCLQNREEPTQQSPGFVRVSIPRSTLLSPYKIKPHKRSSFDPSDSYALSQHCVAGYECSQPSIIPTAKTLDIKHATTGLKNKQVTTLEEAQKEAQSLSRTARLLSTATQPSQRDTGRGRLTQDLLNMSHSLRYDLQKLEKATGFNKRNAPHTTAYPML